MVAVLENPAVRERVMPCSVEHYHQLGELGVLSKRTELIRGAILEKMSQSPLHGSIVECLRVYLDSVLPDGYHTRQEKPLTLADSEPEPDLAVVRGLRSDYFTKHPVTAELVIEVCVSSDVLDRLKLGIYAEAGVAEYWIIFPLTKVVERHSQPGGGRYQKIESVTKPATLASTVFPEVMLLPAALFATE